MALDPDRYVIGDDGLWVEKVGPWATESSTSSATTSGSRRPPGACTARTGRSSSTSSPARAGPIVRDDGSFIDGSPVVAFEQAVKSNAPFTSVEISDLESELLAAAATRLERRKAPGDGGDQGHRLAAQPARPSLRAARSAQSRRPVVLDHPGAGQAEARRHHGPRQRVGPAAERRPLFVGRAGTVRRVRAGLARQSSPRQEPAVAAGRYSRSLVGLGGGLRIAASAAHAADQRLSRSASVLADAAFQASVGT
jgi:hypothetical protein